MSSIHIFKAQMLKKAAILTAMLLFHAEWSDGGKATGKTCILNPSIIVHNEQP